jgi:phosphate transport system protein
MTRMIEGIEKDLKHAIQEMGTVVLRMVDTATHALIARKTDGLGTLRADEDVVNRLHIEIDDRCLKMIALHQPAAADLRMAMAAVKINSDLERIADQAVNIGQTTERLLAQPPLKAKLLDIPRMAELAREMTAESLKAFDGSDIELARSVIAKDDAEDRLKSEAFDELSKIMQADSSSVGRGLGLILVSRNLERIGDHATNIAEDVIFMVLGKDIRHGTEAAKK